MKLAGFLILVAGSGGYGFSIACRVETRLRQLQELCQLLLMIQGEIQYRNAVLEEAFQAIAGRLDGWRSQFLRRLCEKMAMASGETLESLWRQECRRLRKETCLNGKDIQFLEEIGSQIGSLDRKMQVTTLEYFQLRLSHAMEEARQKKEGQCRLYRALGIAGGMLAALVLI